MRRDDQPDSAYRSLGNARAFRSVGRVEIDYGRGYESIGTATLYGGNRLVSAAHVFDSAALSGAERVRINFGRYGTQTINFQGNGVINLHPGYNGQTLANDVAVVFLPQRLQLNGARFYSGSRVKLEKKITFVGYGNTGTGRTGSTRYSNAKRAGENALGRYRSGGRNFEVDFDEPGNADANSLGSARVMRLEGLLGAGDSGGSAWARTGKGWRLVGINSYGDDWNRNGVEDDYGDRSGFIYLPEYERWITSLGAPVEQGASLALSAVPEPGAVGLLAAAGLVFGVQTLRRRATRRTG